jgi:hypothetical protein
MLSASPAAATLTSTSSGPGSGSGPCPGTRRSALMGAGGQHLAHAPPPARPPRAAAIASGVHGTAVRLVSAICGRWRSESSVR